MEATRSDLTKTLLVACDQSYWTGPASNVLDPKYGPIITGTALAEHRDSTSGSADEYPNVMPESWNALGLSAWTVLARFDVADTGFGATIYRRGNSAGTSDYIVAMQGTRGPNIQDWGGNLIYGWDKWSHESVQDPQNGFLRQLVDLSDAKSIHFTGQSLGGALAEYALYDYAVLKGQSFDPSVVTLTTFNGLGSIDALTSKESNFDPNIVANVDTAHFWITNDIVSHLGGGHLNGDGNEYLLDFKAASDEGVPNLRSDGSPIALESKVAHRIESGFYRGFNLAQAMPSNGFPADFSQAVHRPIVDLGLAELAKCGTYLAWLSNQDGVLSTDGEAYARTAAAILASTAFGPKKDFENLVKALADSLYASDHITAVDRALVVRLAPTFLRALAGSPSGIAGELAAQYAAIIFEAGGDSETVQTGQGFGERLVDLVLGGDIPEDATTFDVTSAAEKVGAFLDGANGLSKTEAYFRAAACMAVAIELLPSSTVSAASTAAVSNVLRLVTEDVPDIVAPVYREVSEALRQTVGEKSEAFSANLAELGQSLSKAVVDISKSVSASEADSLARRVQESISNGLADVARSIANAYDGLELKFSDAFEWGASIDRQTLAHMISALRTDASSSSGAENPAFDDALDILESAAQAVVIRPDRGANPFDDGSFDPDAGAVSAGSLAEGSLSIWTVYLPYEAGAGGQQIRLELAGADADKLSILSNGDRIDLPADGAFTLTVAEGSREAAVEIAALADLDADETLTLSATLMDAAGDATHLAHQEAQIALHAREETPPTTAREIRGDWAPFVDPQTGAPLFQDDGFGNVLRDPGVPNDMGFQEPDNKLDGSPDADHVVTGDLEDTVYAYAGDDVVDGSDLLGSIFFGGAGNDWIEAGRYDKHTSDYFEFQSQGRTIRLGEDQLYGGEGDDRIYGDREADVAALYDPQAQATGLPGDWSSGGTGNDDVYGGAGDDVLMGGAGEDLLVGGAGMDVLIGDDQFQLRPGGNFWAVVHPSFGDTTAGFGAFEVGLFPVVTMLDASSEVFALTGDAYFTYYKDGGGTDVLIGGAGKDILIGEAGDDTLYGGEDDDILAGWEGDDQMVGGAGDDLMAGDFGRYEQANERVAGAAELVRPGALPSSSPSAIAVDQTGNDFLDGGAGNDQIWGEGGDDVLLGGDGDDVLYGDAPYLPEELHGADRLDGGAGDDTLYAGGGDDTLFGGTGADLLSGDSGDDLLDGGTGDDQLTGGDGDDALHGGEGDDQLDGGGGNDALDGASGDDMLLGGEGEDVLDGGTGGDWLLGGAGADTYVLSLGGGAEHIDDGDGASRLRLGTGIAADALTATLDAATLTATVNYGFAGDTVSLRLESFQLGGVDFADGASWGTKQFLALVPALVSNGSADADVLLGNEKLRNDLRGMEGDDLVVGSANNDVLEGGGGADALDGGLGGDRYVFTADETGVDRLSDSGVSARDYLAWFYAQRGIADWEERGLHGGQYRAEYEGEEGIFVDYFATLESAIEAVPFATISRIDPLGEIAPIVTRNDSTALSQLQTAGVLDRDVVAFGPGLSLADLDLTVIVDRATAQEHPQQPWYGGGTLSVRWGSAGFDLDVPDVQYGFIGANLFADGVSGNDASAWRGYRLGQGVEAFEFADGSTYSLEELLSHATVLDDVYRFLRGSGSQPIAPGEWSDVRFGPDIRPSEVAAERDGSDLRFRLADGSADGRIAGWYADPATLPSIAFTFSDGTVLDSDAVTRLGLTQYGTPSFDSLDGDAEFASALYGLDGADQLVGGAANDLLDGGPGEDTMLGGAGDDIYAFGTGYGFDLIDESPGDGGSGFDTVRFGESVTPADISVDRDGANLVFATRGGDDVLTMAGWLDTPGGTVERFEFADGTVWDAAIVASMLPPRDAAGEGDDVLFGGFDDDSIHGLGGSDELWGFVGSDSLDGGDGDDYLNGGFGNDIDRAGAGADSVEEVGPGSNFIDGGEGDDYLYNEGHSLVIGGAGDDWIESFGPDSIVLFNRGDGNDTIYAYDRFTLSLGGGLTPTDLALGAEGDDLVLNVGASESIRLTRQFEADRQAWPAITLQMFGSVHEYDFNALIEVLRTAASADSSATVALDAILQAHQESFSETDAVGGALAWQYAHSGTLSGLTDSQVLSIVSAAGFGSAGQPISVGAGNQAPSVVRPLSNQTATEDAPFLSFLPPDTFADPDAQDVLTYLATVVDGDGLPAWLTFDPTTRSFSGTPANEDVGTVSIEVSATDPAGSTASDSFDLTVVNTDDAPLAVADMIAAGEDDGALMLSNASLLANDVDIDLGDSLSIVGVATSAAGARMSLVGGNVIYDPGALFQSLADGQTASDSFEYTASDLSGEISSSTVTVSILGANDAPAPEDDRAFVSEDGLLSIQGNVLANDTDVDAGTKLVVADPGSYAGQYGSLILCADGSYAYTLQDASPAVQSLPDGQEARDVFSYGASDGFTSRDGALTVTVLGRNDSPFAARQIADQVGAEGAVFAFTIPTSAFTDVDIGDTVTLHAQLIDGSPLPTWLAFDPTHGLRGTPGFADGGDYGIRLTATDAAGASASTDFGITILDSLAQGANLVGTPGADVLNGTSTNEILDGRAGSDSLIAGAGDDVLKFYADDKWKGPWIARNDGSPAAGGTGETHPLAGKGRSLDLFDGGTGFDTLAGTDDADVILLDDASSLPKSNDGPRVSRIERIDAGGGRDVVDLTSRRFAYGDVMVDGGAGDDVLWTSSGNDLLIGGRGDDELAGGSGNDVYFYSRGDGEDTVHDTGGSDALLFGGIAQRDVRLERRHDDLIVRVSHSGNDSVTIADWFASYTNRLERIQFADGSAWDANAIEAHFKGQIIDAGPSAIPFTARNGNNGAGEQMPSSGRDDRHGDDDRDAEESIPQAIARYLAKPFCIADTAGLLSEKDAAMPEDEIARRWAMVQRSVQALSYVDAETGAALEPERHHSLTSDTSTGRVFSFGFEASLGHNPRSNGLPSFAGLDEGFTRL